MVCLLTCGQSSELRKEDTMGYIIWPLIGVMVAMVIGAGPRRRAYRPNANSALFAGIFGAMLGGVLGDGLPSVLAGQLTVLSIAGAIVGASIFCWAVRDH